MYRAGRTACSTPAPRRLPRTSGALARAKPCSTWSRDARPITLAVLLRLAAGGDRVRDDGGGGQCPHRFLAVVSADPRRFRLGSGNDRRNLLVWLSRLGLGDAVRRPVDGPARPESDY